MNKKYDLQIENVGVVLMESFEEGENAYENIQQVQVKLSSKHEQSNEAIEAVKPIEIDINSNQQNSNRSKHENKHIEEVQLFLAESWQIPQDRIVITMEGGQRE
jgi:stage III sporulation protein AF